MSNVFRVEEETDERICVSHFIVDDGGAETNPVTGPDYLFAEKDEEEGHWIVDFQDDDETITGFDTKTEAIGAIVQSMLERSQQEDVMDNIISD